MLSALNNIQFVHLSECQLRAFEEAQVAEDAFADILVREATAINSNVQAQSVCSAIEKFDLSWEMVEDQRKQVVVKRLLAIEDLDESQCNRLFDKLDGMIPIQRDTQRRNCIVERMWIMNCTCSLSLSACFLCRSTYFCCLPVIGKVNSEDVGGEAILNNIKAEIASILGEAFQFPLSQMCSCKARLHRHRFNRFFDDWKCSSCFVNQSGRISFHCVDADCSFERISSSVYRVCPSCFEGPREIHSSYETEEKEDGEEGTHIYRQINLRITMIS